MFPGTTTKLSEDEGIALATVISPKKDLVLVTDTATTTVVETINPSFGGGFSGIMIMLNRSGGNITTVTTGNIVTAVTVGQNVAVIFVFSRSLGKWIPGALA